MPFDPRQRGGVNYKGEKNLKQEQLVDSYGRLIDYLRISLTDLCNFRCVYCAPVEGTSPLPPLECLTRDEILRFVQIAGRMGIRRIRLTGGEPLLRKDIVDIVRALKSVKSIKDLSLTTNGSRLKSFLKPLKDAGLDRFNISLDSVNALRFKEITLSDAYKEVMDSVAIALAYGFRVKLNMVVLKGLTQEEIVRFVQMAIDHPLEVRFLEFMPLCGTGWRPDLVIPIKTVRAIVNENFTLSKLPREGNVAESFSISNGQGRVGFIASLTRSFCDQCSRIRLSADGMIRPCLFSDQAVSVKTLLREGASDDAIANEIREAVGMKPRGNFFHEEPFCDGGTNVDQHQQTPLIRFIGG